MNYSLGANPPSTNAPAPSTSGYKNDCTTFSDILIGVQTEWGHANLSGLRRLMTPEMLSYFSDALSANVSQGVENHIDRVTLIEQELEEVWLEDDSTKYATIRFTWSAIDYMESLANPGTIVDGNPNTPVTSTEVWTFMKRIDGGNWILSAVQQVEG